MDRIDDDVHNENLKLRRRLDEARRDYDRVYRKLILAVFAFVGAMAVHVYFRIADAHTIAEARAQVVEARQGVIESAADIVEWYDTMLHYCERTCR